MSCSLFLQDDILVPVREALVYYQDMQRKQEEEEAEQSKEESGAKSAISTGGGAKNQLKNVQNERTTKVN